MKEYSPDYLPEFRCIADRCGHTCCAGWEIDIDKETAAAYQRMPGEIGERLRAHMAREDDVWHFVLDDRERCPMLAENGLCSLITEKGEGALCQICTDHPRYRSFFSDRTETGLGLCCEEAARLVFTWEAPVQSVLTDDDGGDECPDEEEEQLLALREALIAQAQRRGFGIAERVDSIAGSISIGNRLALSRWLPLFMTLEILDPAWMKLLEQARSSAIGEKEIPEFDTAFEQLLVYLLTRHLPGALKDNCAAERIALCVLLWRLVRALFLLGDTTMERLTDIARMMSSEIEYSDLNMERLLDELYEAGQEP